MTRPHAKGKLGIAMRIAAFVALVANVVAAGPVQAETPSHIRTGVRGTSAAYRVETGMALPEGDLSVGLTGSFFSARSVFAAGDDSERQRQALTLHWTPWDRLELFLSNRSTTNRNTAADPQTSQVLGDPEAGAKYSLRVTDWLSAGALISYMAMTSAESSGLRPDAFRLTGLVAGTYTPLSTLEVSINAGYVLDETNRLFSRELDAVERFASDVWNTDAIVGGLAVAGKFDIASVVGVSPFLETHGYFGTRTKAENNPILATAGVRLYPAQDGLLEISLGGDYALSGRVADVANKFPGLPPWEVFARLGAHILPVMPARTEGPHRKPDTCSSDSACSTGQSCVDGGCVVVREVTRTEEIVRPAPTFTIAGSITSQDAQRSIASARISFSGIDASPIAVDPRTGAFRSYPLPCGDGLVQITVTAPGFHDAQTTLARGTPDAALTKNFTLVPTGKDPTGELTGSLKDAATGKPVAGRIFVPTLNLKLSGDADGKFATSVKAGRYQVLISGTGYVTQKTTIDILPSDVVILNVDLVPER